MAITNLQSAKPSSKQAGSRVRQAMEPAPANDQSMRILLAVSSALQYPGPRDLMSTGTRTLPSIQHSCHAGHHRIDGVLEESDFPVEMRLGDHCIN